MYERHENREQGVRFDIKSRFEFREVWQSQNAICCVAITAAVLVVLLGPRVAGESDLSNASSMSSQRWNVWPNVALDLIIAD